MSPPARKSSEHVLDESPSGTLRNAPWWVQAATRFGVQTVGAAVVLWWVATYIVQPILTRQEARDVADARRMAAKDDETSKMIEKISNSHDRQAKALEAMRGSMSSLVVEMTATRKSQEATEEISQRQLEKLAMIERSQAETLMAVRSGVKVKPMGASED